MLEFHNVTEVYSKREQQLSLLESRNLKKKYKRLFNGVNVSELLVLVSQ